MNWEDFSKLSQIKISYHLTCSSKSANGDWCGLSKANKASVRSSSFKTSGFVSPASEILFCAKVSASSILPFLINSIRCSCCRWKYKCRSLSSRSGWSWLMRLIDSWILPDCTASRMRILLSSVDRSTSGSTPDSSWNFSAASLNPSESLLRWIVEFHRWKNNSFVYHSPDNP